jgi:hypothetical protein
MKVPNLSKMLYLSKMLFVVLTAQLFLGCSNGKLTRGKAEELLKAAKKSQFDKYEVIITEHTCTKHLPYDTGDYEALKKEGLLNYEIINVEGMHVLQANLTKEGEEYLEPNHKPEDIPYDPDHKFVKVKTFQLEFGEVTGIMEYKDHNQAMVEYTFIKKPTPFGRISYHLDEEKIREKATFMKYDDGWRLVK